MAVEVTQAPPVADQRNGATAEPVGLYGGGRARQQSRPARRQGRRPRGHDPGRAARAAGVHDHDRRVQCLPGRAGAIPGGHVGSDARRAAQARSQVGPQARRRRQPAARLGALGRARVDAGHDGHRPQSRPERRHRRRAGDADEQRALRLGRVPPLRPDVRPHRPGRPGERLDHVFDRPRSRPPVPSRTPTSTPTSCAPSPSSSRRSSRRETGQPFPTDVLQQLELAIKAVFNSWMGKRAVDYRNQFKIPHDLGTAVNVVTMVFGNMGDDSGTGVAFTRNPSTGQREIYGEFLPNAQGEDVVAGIRTPISISKMREVWPEVYKRVRADRRPPGADLQGRPGPRVHRRARQAVHAPDAQRQAHREGGRGHGGRHGRRRADHTRRGAQAHPADARAADPRAAVRPRLAREGGRADRQGPGGLAWAARRQGRLRSGSRGGRWPPTARPSS